MFDKRNPARVGGVSGPYPAPGAHTAGPVDFTTLIVQVSADEPETTRWMWMREAASHGVAGKPG